ncbi:MAG: glycosyltransferase family 1 protein [Ktedonobacteraceae bacterium]
MSKKLLRIGVDLTGIWRRPTGIFRYAAEVAKNLLHEADPSVRYVLFFAREVHPDFKPLQDSFDAVICPTTNELLIKQVWFPLVLPRLHLDMMHYPSFPPPLLQLFGPRSVMTFHDAGPWRYAEALTLHGRIYFRILLKQGVRTCASVITVSRHAKTEIGSFLGHRYLPKITVIPEAARPEFAIPRSDAFKAEVRRTYALPDQYFFAVATVEPRKNLVTLLAAYKHLKQQLNKSDTPCPPLVIVGRKGWNCDDILGYMAELQGAVLFPGHVSDEELIALYQMATCLVFPSLYEGFGLPVLEAMMACCPVITSTTSSLPEVAGDAAFLVEPLDAHAIADAMQRILTDDVLRRQMVQKGYEQACRFSWQETARMTREVYVRTAQP